MEASLRELWVPVSAAIAQQKNVETIANNVANANTPGFKRDQLVFKEQLTAIENGLAETNLPEKEWKPEDFYRTYNTEDSFVKVEGSYSNFEQGQLTPTGNQFDIALKGPGLLEVLTPNGSRYIRKGSLSVNSDGKLVTDHGYLILSKAPPPTLNPDGTLNFSTPLESRAIMLGNNKLTISQNGDVFAGDAKISELAITEFNQPSKLQKEGNSLFINNDLQNIKLGTYTTTTHQGFVEQSNVNAISEMSQLINANRNFESIQRVIKTYDSLSSKAVNELGKF